MRWSCREQTVGKLCGRSVVRRTGRRYPVAERSGRIGGGPRISATGVDLAEMVTYAREVGGPALSAMTFHERAGALKALALTLMAGKAEFYTLSTATGGDDARFRGGHRRRIRDPAELREQGSARIARQHSLSGRKRRASRQRRNLPRATHLYITSRRRRADQRLQFPGVGVPGEAGTGIHRGGAVHRQTCQFHGISHRTRLPAHHRVRLAPRGFRPTALR